jgi:hypothetical protein
LGKVPHSGIFHAMRSWKGEIVYEESLEINVTGINNYQGG